MPNKIQWMRVSQNDAKPPYIAVFRNRFCAAEATELSFEYSADENAIVFLDGDVVACGPERGCASHWYKDKVALAVSAGEHVLAFRVSCLGYKLRPFAQMSVAHGLWFCEETNLLAEDGWLYRIMPWKYDASLPDWGSAPKVSVPAAFVDSAAWGVDGGAWRPVEFFDDGRELHPAELPPMRNELLGADDYSFDGRLLLLKHYGCFRAEYLFEGEGSVELRWREALNCEGKLYGDEQGVYWDKFELAGRPLHWHDIWFRAGKAVEFRCGGTARVREVRLHRIGYPWKYDLLGELPQELRMRRLIEKSLRTFECCTWQTYMDCPYFEQLQYIGDSRLEMLLTYSITSDRRLPRKALMLFAEGLRADGAMACRQPGKDTVDMQCNEPTPNASPLIPSFSLLYIQMLHDYANLEEDASFVRTLLPVARCVAAWALKYVNDGILKGIPGWNFIDWVKSWGIMGIPPNCVEGTGCTLNLLLLQSLRDLADLEKRFGDAAQCESLNKKAETLRQGILAHYYVKEKGLFAEDEAHGTFSEHAQVWAQLTGLTDHADAALRSGRLDECGIAFSFYYLLAARRFGLNDLFERRLERYLALADDESLDTLPEEFSDWRSFCHAWSAHTIYFFQKSK